MITDTNADMFTKLEPHYGGNKIPRSYHNLPDDEPDDYHALPWYIRRFVDSICER